MGTGPAAASEEGTVHDCRTKLSRVAVTLFVGLMGWTAGHGSSAAAQASAACAAAPAPCTVASSEQIALSAGQTINRTVACPDVSPVLFDSSYTTSNPAVLVTQGQAEDGSSATFTALNRANALIFVTFHAGCVP